MLYLLITLFTQNPQDTIYDLRDFRIPDAGVSRLYVNADLYGYVGFGKYEDDPYGYGSIWSPYMRTGGRFNWEFDFLGEKRYANISLAPSLAGDLSLHRHYYYSDTLDTVYIDTVIGIGVWLEASSQMGWYLGKSPWFLGFSGDFWGSEWIYPEEGIDLYWPWLSGELFVGGGVGKIRNVTQVIHAWQFLEELGLANKDDIETLAELLAKQWSYKLKYWRYEKYFYADVEKLLAEKGVVTRLSPYDAMRLREIIAGSYDIRGDLGRWGVSPIGWFPEGRLYGARLRLGLGFRGENTLLPSGNPLFEPGLEIELDASYPISRRWQVGGGADARAFYHALSNLEYNASLGAYGRYYFDERWRIGSSVGAALEPNSNVTPHYRLWIGVTPLELAFYIDERLWLNAELKYLFGSYEYYDPENRHNLSWAANLIWRLR